jgi:predicted dehydrogenase
VSSASTKRRYAIIGAGMRARMYVDAIIGEHSDVAELVVLADTNPERVAAHTEWMLSAGAGAPSPEGVDDVAGWVRKHAVDRVIVTSPDVTHARHVVAALHGGADVVVEKPLTIDASSARDIARAVEETGRDVTVTFNYRYSPRNSTLREVIGSGAIGEITSVHFEWLLDTKHGADYFRRWHRDKSFSGGLLVHKASHHFDLVNWWLSADPTRVYASGGLRFYGPGGGGRPAGERPPRGTVDAEGRDPFRLDLRDDPVLRRLYLQAEAHDGYLRDRDVFSEGISIEDNLSLVVDYSSGASMSYSLNAHSPWEGYNVAVNGTLGRAELRVVERAAVGGADNLDPSYGADAALEGAVREAGEHLVVQNHWAAAREVPIVGGEGDHGGGDLRLLADVFRGRAEDPLGRPADWRDGVRSIAVGIAGNLSLESGGPVRIADLDLGISR